MKTSTQGVDFVIEREGMRQTMYRDSVGLPTIGVGHLLTKPELASGVIQIAGTAVEWKNGLTDRQVKKLLVSDLAWVETAINGLVSVELTQYQFDALASFVFNVGAPNFKKSTLLRKLNNGDYEAVPSELKRWNKAGGRVSNGLVNRRELETKLWLGELYNNTALQTPIDEYDLPHIDEAAHESEPNGVGQVSKSVGQARELLGQALRSKINWVALSALGLINVTVFKGNLTPEQIQQIVPYLADGVLLLIMLLRSFFPSNRGVQ